MQKNEYIVLASEILTTKSTPFWGSTDQEQEWAERAERVSSQ